MKTGVLLILFFLLYYVSNAQNYLVTKNGDTVYIKGTLDVNHTHSARWTEVAANGIRYTLSEIKCIQLENDFYCNIHNRRLWKRVVKGRINVFALQDKDTIRNKKGQLPKSLFMQKEFDETLLEYNIKNLASAIKDNDSLSNFAQNKIHSRRGGKVLMAGGIATLGVSAFTLLIEGILAVLSSNVENLEIYAIISTTGVIIGAGALATGLVISKKAKSLNLDPVYYYNSQPN